MGFSIQAPAQILFGRGMKDRAADEIARFGPLGVLVHVQIRNGRSGDRVTASSSQRLDRAAFNLILIERHPKTNRSLPKLRVTLDQVYLIRRVAP